MCFQEFDFPLWRRVVAPPGRARWRPGSAEGFFGFIDLLICTAVSAKRYDVFILPKPIFEKMPAVLKKTLVLLVVAFLVAGVLIVQGLRSTVSQLPDAYSVWGTGDLVVAHLERKGRMPKNWEELRPFWDEGRGMHARIGPVKTFEDLMDRIVIEFDRLPEVYTFLGADAKSSGVIYPVSGSSLRWEGHDAEEMIREYLLTRSLVHE